MKAAQSASSAFRIASRACGVIGSPSGRMGGEGTRSATARAMEPLLASGEPGNGKEDQRDAGGHDR